MNKYLILRQFDSMAKAMPGLLHGVAASLLAVNS